MPSQPESSQPDSPRARGGRPPRLSRAEIVAAARRIVDAAGVAELTMRRLAREIGSTPMALYHHVKDKEELLVLLLDDYADRIPRPELAGGPHERIVAAATAMRDALAACPWIAEVLTTDAFFSASVLWFPEAIVDACVEAGLPLDQSVLAYRTIWYFTTGEILVRANAARRGAENPAPSHRERLFAEQDLSDYPRLAELRGRWTAIAARDHYRDSLAAIVRGLLAG